jgi:hypothetical protein
MAAEGVRINPTLAFDNDPITGSEGGGSVFASYLGGDKWYFSGPPLNYGAEAETLLELAIYAHTIP